MAGAAGVGLFPAWLRRSSACACAAAAGNAKRQNAFLVNQKNGLNE